MKGVFSILFVTVCLAGLCPAAPQPAIVQAARDWTLDVRYENLAQITVSLEGQNRRFWYLILTLTNKTGTDAAFYPKCDLMTDTFSFTPAGSNVPQAVFEQIKRRHQAKYPFLASLEKTDNRILQGSDNTRDIAVIWPDFDAKAKSVKLFIAGLSNETAVIDHPVERGENNLPKKIFLRKTLEMNYTLAGDPTFRSDTKLTLQSKRWIMR